MARFEARLDEGAEQGIGRAPVRHMQRPVAAMERVAAVLVRFGALEIGQHVGERPAFATHLPPAIVIARVAADIDHAVDGRRAAPAAAARPIEPAPVQMLLAFGVEIPIVRIAFAEQRRNAGRHVDHERLVAPARLDQQHLDGGIGRQPVRQHAPRAPRAHDDVIECFHGCVLRGQRAQSIPARDRTQGRGPFLNKFNRLRKPPPDFAAARRRPGCAASQCR